MSHNVNELNKIKDKTSGWFKGKSRSAIADSIGTYKPKIESAKSLDAAEQNKALIALVNQATNDRHAALRSGANSYGNPKWAAAATIESWLFELISGDSQDIKNVEIIINELYVRK